ncbi:MAG TPA: AIPR family protein [Streptosporangiaceae bacterium]|nr:AIPR family protein [Streptosporangiaceae bacterium]
MSDLTLEAYAQDLLADILATAEAESSTTPETFTRRALDDLEQAGVTENTFTAYYRAHGIEVSGYGSNDSLGTLDLFISSFRQYPDSRMNRAEAETLFRRLAAFIQRCRDGLRHEVDESLDVYDMCLAVEKKLPETSQLRLFLLTNSITSVSSFPDSSLDGIPVSCEIWDLARFHRMATSGTLSEPIVVEFDDPLPCLATPETDQDFSVFLTILPGATLAGLYGQYGTRLLELNVRSFLQAKGAVNRGIRDTLLTGPGRFLAYNNGITATASTVEFCPLTGGGQAIRRIHDLQIVNGGQTTASIHYASVRDKADISGVFVQMKLTVVAPQRLQEIVPEISKYSNTQNKVTLVDFSSNHPYHVELEKITRSLWAPAADGSGQETRWFYERARGQYADALARERTPARQRTFKTLHPLRQKFTKADAAKFEDSWDQLPHVVSRGAEKNFREFMIRLGEHAPHVDAAYCQRLIAKAILFRTTEKIVSAHQFGGYRANIVTYAIAKLSQESGQRIDLDRIWREQRLTPALVAAIDHLCVPVHEVITRPYRVANVTEWAKRPECWSRVLDIEWKLPGQLRDELIDPSAAAKRGRHAATDSEADSAYIAAVTAIPAEDWLAVARWAKETRNLEPWQRQIALTIAQNLGRGGEISVTQATQGQRLMEEAQQLGFQAWSRGSLPEQIPAATPVGPRYEPRILPADPRGGSRAMSGGLAEGTVVTWNGRDGFGVIQRIADGRVEVRWDAPGEQTPSIFVAHNAPLTRVVLPPRVRRVSTDQAGILGARVGEDPPTWKVTVLGPTGFIEKVVPEADLRPDHAVDPATKMASGQIGTPAQFNLQLVTRFYQLEHLHNDLVSLGGARVDVKPHQVSVVHRVATSYPHRFLLCDEVGLGKTIEAGMILKELRARKQARRTLIIVPPNLLRQWQFELKSKFNETFSILNTATVNYLRSQGRDGNPFSHSDSVLVSADWVCREERASLAARADWDMVIVDEAHHARLQRWGKRTQATQLYNLVKRLSSPEHFANRALLFLTATPMQLQANELYSLVELIDPALFPTEENFEQHRRSAPGLNRLVEQLRTHGFPLPGREPEEVVAQVGDWLGIDPELARKRLTAGPAELEALCDDLASRHLLSEVLVRNRKAVVGGFMPRRATRWEVDLREDERRALAAVEGYVLTGFNVAERTSDNAIGFVMVIFQKLMASSIQALRESLAGRRARLLGRAADSGLPATELEAGADDDRGAAEVVGETGSAYASEAADIGRLLELLDQVEIDSKAEALLGNLALIFDHDPDAKVLIFTEFRETQRYLSGRIAAKGWNVHLFHGQQQPLEKDRSVERFRDETGPQVLISTEAGGEGRNFQFCHLLVNYDLPWNPMRVEQRIGRIDRIGQDNVVQIFNFWVKGTIEERVLNVLERRINVFEDTVGGLDPILGGTEKDLRQILRLAEADRDRALSRLGDHLEQQVKVAREAEVKLRDFIMDTKSFSREIAERIARRRSPVTADDQERLITTLLADVRTHIARHSRGEWQLTFNDPFTSEYPELFVDGRKLRAVFRADDRKDTQLVEYFAFGHPIVEAIVERVLDTRYPGTTGTRRIAAGDDLGPMCGWLFTYVITVPGIRPASRMLPVLVTDDHAVSPEAGEALIKRSCLLPRGGEPAIPPDEIPFGSLAAAQALADRFVTEAADALERTAREQARRRADRERGKLEAYFDYRQRAAADRLAATAATLARLEASPDDSERRIIPAWQANLSRDQQLVSELADERARQLTDIEKLLHPVADWELVSAGRIEIIADEQAASKVAEDPVH